MMRLIWKICLSILGWKIPTSYPHEIKKAVVIVAPHTSAWDFVLGLAVRSVMHMEYVKYLGKAELFKGPFGFFFRWTGGIPVERSEKHHLVENVVALFNQSEKMVIVLSPEGTRKKVTRLKTGFYHIAKSAHVPIILTSFDFQKKEVRFSEPFYTTHDEVADFKKIIHHFAGVQGKIPDQGLAHLL